MIRLFWLRSAFRVLALRAKRRLINKVWTLPNCAPVFFTNIDVDFDDAGIKRILAVLSAVRYPIIFRGFNIEEIGFVSGTLKRLKFLVAVINRLAGFRKPNATDAAGASNAGFSFDVHDLRLHRCTDIIVRTMVGVAVTAHTGD